MAQVPSGTLHKFLTGETVTGDDTQVATNINTAFDILRVAQNDTDTKVNNTYTKTQVDDKVTLASTGVASVNETPTALSLVNGLQVVTASKTTPYNVLNIVGRTLVNLLGRDGNCEDLSVWGTFQVTQALDSNNKAIGNNSIKLTISSGFTSGSTSTVATRTFSFTGGKYYIAVMDIKNGNATNGNFYINGASATKGQNTITATDKFYPAWRAYNPASTINNLSMVLGVNGAATQYAFFDAVRIYEITTQSEYNALDTMTADQIAAKYPYVDDVKHVNAPYVIKYGENLLPTFNEWIVASGTMTITAPYAMSFVATANTQYVDVDIPIVGGQQYTLSATTTGKIGIDQLDANGNIVQANGWSATALTFTALSTAVKARVYLGNDTLGAGTYTFSNVILNLGTTAKPFKPRNDDTLFIPNTQLASNLDGTVYDQVFKRDGKYFVEKRFKDMVLDGSLAWVYHADNVGSKQVRIDNVGATPIAGTKRVVKYDGKILANPSGGILSADQVYTSDSNAAEIAALYLSIADADSGWGETYTPTAGEIQAYFYGWKMYAVGSPATDPYTTGTKAWARRLGGTGTNFVDGTQTLPTAPALQFLPYKLTYQLATPTFEEIQVEGGLSLHEGQNQIEMGQGVIVREKANPVFNNTAPTYYHINSASVGYEASRLRNRTDKILGVYRNGKLDNRWVYLSGSANGNWQARILAADYDASATYEVSYIPLDQYLLSSSLQTVNGEYSANIKTIVDTLATSQADLDARVGVAENLARQIYQVPQKTTKDISLYVDGTNGSDSNDGSAGKPLKTIQKAVDSIPQVVNHAVIISVAAGTYGEDIVIQGQVGSGYVSFVTTGGIVTINSFDARYCSRILINGFTASTTTKMAFKASNGGAIDIINCIATGATATYHGIYLYNNKAYVNGCTVSNKNYGVSADYNSQVQCNANSGSGNTFAYVTTNSGIMTYVGTTPTGTTFWGQANGGTLINGNTGVLNPWGDNTRDTRSGCRLDNTAGASISAATATKVAWNSLIYDNLNEFSTGTSRFTASSDGIYNISTSINFSSNGTGLMYSAVYKNGVLDHHLCYQPSNVSSTILLGSTQVKLAKNDYIEIYIYTAQASTLTTSYNFLRITRIA
jgi:hypothetical protein